MADESSRTRLDEAITNAREAVGIIVEIDLPLSLYSSDETRVIHGLTSAMMALVVAVEELKKEVRRGV